MLVSKKTFVVSVLGVFWGIIFISIMLGGWQTKITTEQVVVESAKDLKGWMQVKEVLKYLNISNKEMGQILKIKGKIDPEKKMKDLASENGKTADEYKEALENYLESKNVKQIENDEKKN